MAPRKPGQEWSDSDRARLDAILQKQELEDAIADRRKKRAETVKAWAQWIAAVSVAGGVIWDGLLKLANSVRAYIP